MLWLFNCRNLICQENEHATAYLQERSRKLVTKKNARNDTARYCTALLMTHHRSGVRVIGLKWEYNFFLLPVFADALTERLEFLREAIRCHGECKWHIIIDSAASRFGIEQDPTTGRTAAAKLGIELRYMLFLISLSIIYSFLCNRFTFR